MGKLVGKRNYSTNNKATEEHCAFHCAFRRASTATAFSSTAATFAASGTTNMLATCPWRTGQGKSSNLTGSTMSTNLTGYSFIATIKKKSSWKDFLTLFDDLHFQDLMSEIDQLGTYGNCEGFPLWLCAVLSSWKCLSQHRVSSCGIVEGQFFRKGLWSATST